MTPEVLAHMAYQISNAVIQPWPFPHIYVQEVFPWDFYQELLANLPPVEKYYQGAKNYNGRKFAEQVPDLVSGLSHPDFIKIAVRPFKPWVIQRSLNKVFTDLRLIRDQQNYAIGPHTDAAWKVLSLLFYLPPDGTLWEHGTSLYVPKDPSFRCQGGPHHPVENFTRVYTAPFIPNSMIAFFKTDYSFHGVEPITVQCQRDVLLWNLYDRQPPNG